VEYVICLACKISPKTVHMAGVIYLFHVRRSVRHPC